MTPPEVSDYVQKLFTNEEAPGEGMSSGDPKLLLFIIDV
jgi:hypothetical protein